MFDATNVFIILLTIVINDFNLNETKEYFSVNGLEVNIITKMVNNKECLVIGETDSLGSYTVLYNNKELCLVSLALSERRLVNMLLRDIKAKGFVKLRDSRSIKRKLYSKLLRKENIVEYYNVKSKVKIKIITNNKGEEPYTEYFISKVDAMDIPR